jgi:macrodomain Ter protein organizer (MatP/YcbG family)
MSETQKPLKWLRKQDDEWKWAAEYLRERLSAREMTSLSSDALTQFSSYENTAISIRQLKETRLDLIIKLQGAIRQRRYRSDSNGRKPRTFSLSKQTLTKLSSIAKRHNGDETAAITALIEREGMAIEAERDYKKLLKEAIALEQKFASLMVKSMTEQRDKAIEITKSHLQLLAQWELSHPEEAPPVVPNDDSVTEFVQTRMDIVNLALGRIALEYDLITGRRTQQATQSIGTSTSSN